MAMADSKPAADRLRVARPLSPHLQIFRPIFSMMMSIVHRITGGALYVGTVLLAVWLVAAATGRSGFDQVNWFLGTIVGQLILLGYTWALLHHMLGGIKHLVWDTGAGFGAQAREQMNRWSLIGSIALTILVWVVGYSLR
jgi:succinate dehydrogenase / fumarate reductase, cytochrome b subunit